MGADTTRSRPFGVPAIHGHRVPDGLALEGREFLMDTPRVQRGPRPSSAINSLGEVGEDLDLAR